MTGLFIDKADLQIDEVVAVARERLAVDVSAQAVDRIEHAVAIQADGLAEDEAALAHLVERGDLMRQQHRVAQRPRTDPPRGQQDDGGHRRLNAVEHAGDGRYIAEGQVDPGERDQNGERGQHEQHAGHDAAEGHGWSQAGKQQKQHRGQTLDVPPIPKITEVMRQATTQVRAQTAEQSTAVGETVRWFFFVRVGRWGRPQIESTERIEQVQLRLDRKSVV